MTIDREDFHTGTCRCCGETNYQHLQACMLLDAAGPVLKVGNLLIPIGQVRHVSIDRIEQQIATVETLDGKVHDAMGFDAIEIVMQLKPSAIEGRRLKWRKGAWRFHNWVGHPLMDLLAMMGYKKAAIRWHDHTTPRSRDIV